MELQIGSTVGGYGVEAFVAEGGMSLIYRVRHLDTGSVHALKVLAIHTRSVRDRLRQEGALQRMLRHPNIVPVTEVIQLPHGPGLIMDYVEGPDLAELMQRHPLSDAQTDALVRGILTGMTAAHANGMIHRDLKPSNILLAVQDGTVTPRIIDFGLAKMWAEGDEPSLTQSGATMGTPSYMAPEQIWDASSVDERADVFSLGTIVYEMLSGKRAFVGRTNIDVWSRIASGKRELLSALRPDLPAQVVQCVHRAMATDRDKRTPTVAAFLDEWTAANAAQAARVEAVWDEALLKAAQGRLVHEVHPTVSFLAPSNATTLYGFVTGAEAATSLATTVSTRPTPRGPAALPNAPEPLGNLPIQGDRFIGRERELTALTHMFATDRPVITLTGPGGMGKTRLSIQYAETQREAFPGGVWFCDLTATQTEHGILQAVAQALRVPLREQQPVLQLAQAMDGRGRMLLILDNMEQLVNHAPSILGCWVDHAPNARFLVTSRIHLGLQSEQTFELGPIDGTEGVALFEERARNLTPSYALNESERGLVAEIVERVDGMSLAIELAAARTRVLKPDQILARLDERFRLLNTGRRDQTARQATLEGAIDWSWELLSPAQKAALVQCSAFRGGFTLPAAEAVIDVEPWDSWPLDLVQQLVEQSLVRSVTSATGQLRFQLYESIREYALHKLQTPGAVMTPDGHSMTGHSAVAAIALRHGAHYAALGSPESLEARFWGASPTERNAFRLERENLEQALATNQQGAHLHAQLTAAWAAIHQWYGPHLPALTVVKATLERPDLPPHSRLQLLEIAGELHGHSDQREERRACIIECLELARMLRDRAAEGRALSQHFMYREGDKTDPERIDGLRAAIALLQSEGDWRGEFDAMLRLGETLLIASAIEESSAVAKAMVEKAMAAGCRLLQAIGLRFRAGCHMDRGDMNEAEQDLKHAMNLAESLEKPLLWMQVNGALGTLYKELGKLDESVACHEAGIRFSRQYGIRRVETIIMGNLALILQLQGRVDDAKQMYLDTVRLDQTRGGTMVGHIAMGNLGDLLLREGETDESMAHLRAAIAALDETHPAFAAAFRGSLAWATAQAGQTDEARNLLHEAESQLRGTWAVETGRLLCRRAQVEHHAGCADAAAQALAEATAIAERLGGNEESDLGQMLTDTIAIMNA